MANGAADPAPEAGMQPLTVKESYLTIILFIDLLRSEEATRK